MNKELLKKAIEEFKWESQEQKEGYLAWISYLKNKDQPMPREVDLFIAFMIQKNHEAAQYWRETLETQIDLLRRENLALAEKLG